jgi:hypothetical protein
MELLGDLVGKAQTPHRRDHGNAQLLHTLDPRFHQVNESRLSGPKINLNRLPGAGPILDCDLDTDGVRLFHVPGLRLHSKCELVEAQAQGVRERMKAPRASAFQHQVQILCGANALCEAQLHRDAAFETVRAQDAFAERSFKDPTKRQKRNPTP